MPWNKRGAEMFCCKVLKKLYRERWTKRTSSFFFRGFLLYALIQIRIQIQIKILILILIQIQIKILILILILILIIIPIQIQIPILILILILVNIIVLSYSDVCPNYPVILISTVTLMIGRSWGLWRHESEGHQEGGARRSLRQVYYVFFIVRLVGTNVLIY